MTVLANTLHGLRTTAIGLAIVANGVAFVAGVMYAVGYAAKEFGLFSELPVFVAGIAVASVAFIFFGLLLVLGCKFYDIGSKFARNRLGVRP